MDKSPYRMRGLTHLSATSIQNFCSCEAQAAYRRIFIGVPETPEPLALAFGVAVHTMVQRVSDLCWKQIKKTGGVSVDQVKPLIRYGIVFLQTRS
jgi:hypothetical protein